MSQRIFNVKRIAKNINSLSSLDPIFGTYVLQQWNHCWATIYINYVHRLHGSPLFLCHSVYFHCNNVQNGYGSCHETFRIISNGIGFMLLNSPGGSTLQCGTGQGLLSPALIICFCNCVFNQRIWTVVEQKRPQRFLGWNKFPHQVSFCSTWLAINS